MNRTTTPTDPLAILSSHRPTDERLADAWTDTRADAAFERIAHRAASPTPPPILIRGTRRRPIRRWVALGGVAAALAIGVFAASTILAPRGSLSTAAALNELAGRAAAQPVRAFAVGDLGHMIVRESQDGRVPGTGDFDRSMESWIDASGTMWRKDTDASGVTYYKFPLASPTVNSPTAAFLAGLPTDRDALAAYLRDHTRGSSSPNEAVFVGVGDMLRWGLSSPALNQTAIKVLGTLPEVTTSQVTFAGHAALRVDFTDDSIRPGVVQSLYFDRATAAILGDSMAAPELDFTRTVLDQGVAESLPADVSRNAVDEGAGAKATGTTGTPGPAPTPATK